MAPESISDPFMAMIESNKGILFKVANSYCRDPENRNDLIQEIILQLWKSFSHYSSQFKYSTWIYRIALNVAISNYRTENKRSQIKLPISEAIMELADSRYQEEKEEKLTLLQQYISELKEIDRALMLLYLDEKSHKEIAEITGISETNVATKIGRIKILLKQKFLSL